MKNNANTCIPKNLTVNLVIDRFPEFPVLLFYLIYRDNLIGGVKYYMYLDIVLWYIFNIKKLMKKNLHQISTHINENLLHLIKLKSFKNITWV